MFGLTFLFSAALFALPLAGLPVILHLLFRKKSPVVLFPTLRFIKSSIQRTAARRRVHRWLLLATRALLLALLIWAIAQPAKLLSSGWFGGGSSVAAIVIDTSYSMQYQPQEVSLLSRSGTMVQELLREQLKDARVAIFRSQPAPPDRPEQLLPATQVLAEWTDATPQASPAPLVDRIAAARAMLSKENADQKWLIVLTDSQNREFPHATGEAENLRCVWFDLRPDVARSAGVTNVAVEPRSVLAGLRANLPVTVIGRPNDAHAVSLAMTTPDGKPVAALPPLMANLDVSGQSTVPFTYTLPAERWLLIGAALPQGDEMPWDNQRQQLIELPPRQKVAVVASPDAPSGRYLRLALDPSEGRSASWPIELVPVALGTPIPAEARCVVVALTRWPDLQTANRLRDLARSGGTVVLFVQPGLEETYARLDGSLKSILKELLPSEPIAGATTQVTATGSPLRATITNETQADAIMDGLTDERFRIGEIGVQRVVPFSSADQSVSPLLRLTRQSSDDASAAARAAPAGSAASGRPLLLRKTLGSGKVYTLATLPESRYTNLATHPIFLPLLVRMALQAGGANDLLNIELGRPLILPATYAGDASELQIVTPTNATYVLPATRDEAGRRFVFNDATEPGLYRWSRVGQIDAVAYTNVQLPAAEADLKYRDPSAIVPQTPSDAGSLTPTSAVVIVKSMEELQGKLAAISQPQPRWTTPIAIVLLLLCAEALLGSITRVSQKLTLRLFPSKPAEA